MLQRQFIKRNIMIQGVQKTEINYYSYRVGRKDAKNRPVKVIQQEKERIRN